MEVSLFVRLWVEIFCIRIHRNADHVSLFVRLWVEMPERDSRPQSRESSASSWGCELKWLISIGNTSLRRSASSWGCELKYEADAGGSFGTGRQPLREAVSWNNLLNYTAFHFVVSLFVRLWVEIVLMVRLKTAKNRQPLREAVSWNTISWIRACFLVVSLFVRLWVEMLSELATIIASDRQPLREAVSWNECAAAFWDGTEPSASSWGCELKYDGILESYKRILVSLFVRLWVEIP